MRILVLVLAGCGAAPPPPVTAVPSDAAPAEEPPVVTRSAPSVPGIDPAPRGVEKAAFRATLKRHVKEISACHETWSVTGKVVIRFTIGPTGHVLRSQASGAQGELENCIADIAGLVFEPPASGGSIIVSYP